MNAAPRLACRLVRICSLWAGPDEGAQPAAGWAARHVAACPACAQHFAALESLDTQLRRQARRPDVPVPVGLEERITRAVAASLAQPRPRPVAQHAWGLAGASLALVGALAVAVIALRWEQPRNEGDGGTLTAGGELFSSEPVPSASEVRERAWTPLAPTVAALSTENPLEREIRAVQADTRSALRFLARNFLPSSTGMAGSAENEANAS